MKHLLSVFAFALLAALPASAQEARQDFVLVNRTGYTVTEVYVSPSKANDWEEDVLGDDELEDGKSQPIHFSRATKSCMWDLKVVYADDDSSAVWNDINLCEVSRITIRYNRRSGSTSATFD